jgi:hypothetical protein
MGKVKRDILYKVVRADSRLSLVVGRSYYNYDVREKYALMYEKGKLVKAPVGSFGVFCFKTKEDAHEFMNYNSLSNPLCIRVLPYGKQMKVPNELCIMAESLNSIKELYNIIRKGKYVRGRMTWNVPHGTVCYQGVRVID